MTNLHILASKNSTFTTSKQTNSKKKVLLGRDYCYDPTNKQLFLNDKEIVLTKKEIELIAFLCKKRDIVVIYEDIITSLWNEKTSQQTLRSLIHRIRQKTYINFIVSVSKRGYKLSF